MSRTIGTALLVLAALLVGVLASEVAYRAARRFVCIGVSASPLWEPNAEYGWSHRPGGTGWEWGCIGRRFEWRVFSRISGAGLRDVEHPVAKTPGVARILLLGDSITEAVQVPLEQSFARLLEASLNAHGLGVEVVNAGVSGYGTDNELLYFRAEGHRWNPDVVLLVFNLQNDVLENSATLYPRMYAAAPDRLMAKPHFRLDPDGSLQLEPIAMDAVTPGLAAGAWSALEQRVFVLRALGRVVRAELGARVEATPQYPLVLEIDATPVDAEWREAWDLTRALVRALRAEVERQGARFVVAVTPTKEQITPDLLGRYGILFPAMRERAWDAEQPLRTIETFLADEGVPWMTLRAALRSHFEATGSTGFYDWDVHLRADGHRVVADALADFLEPMLRAGASDRH